MHNLQIVKKLFKNRPFQGVGSILLAHRIKSSFYHKSSKSEVFIGVFLVEFMEDDGE